ncbi:MAG: tetratricopeptide repeat protein, partial [bacterium]
MKLIRILCSLIILTGVMLCIIAGCTAKKSDKIPLTTSSQEALDLFKKGRDLQERLQFQESRQYFEQAVDKAPDFAMAWLYLSFTEATNKGFFEKLDKAVALTDKVSDGEYLWIQGTEAGINGFPMQQRKLYKKLVELYPQDERAQNLLGIHYFGQQEWEKSVAYFTRATQINPNFSQPYNQLGYAHRFLEDYNGAEIAFKRYIDLIPNDPNPYDSYAELLMKMGRFDESISYYEKALDQNPNFVASQTGIALNLNLKGDFETARARLQELFESARNDAEKRNALFAVTTSYVFEGKMENALEALQQQYEIAAATNDVGAMAGDVTTTGSVLIQMGKIKEAGEKYDAAYNLVQNSDLAPEIKDNNHRNHYYNMARVALYSGAIDEAI